MSCAKCHKGTYDPTPRASTALPWSRRRTGTCPSAPTATAPTSSRSDRASFRLDSPDMCAKCHADAELMRKYDLSPNVFETYVEDFHGTTVALAKQQ